MSFEYKRCPRCGQKASLNASVCSECNLKFDRLKNLSNMEAKKAIKNREKGNILYITERPKDVITKKFYMLYILLGIFGAYNIYIGKYKRGFYSLITVSLALLLFTLREILIYNSFDVSALNYYVVEPVFIFAVFGVLIWFIDLVALFTHTFKYPACISSEDYINYLLKSKSSNNSSRLKDTPNKNNKKDISS